MYISVYCNIGAVKPGIHLRLRQAKVRCGSLSSASVHGATNQAACLKLGLHMHANRLRMRAEAKCVVHSYTVWHSPRQRIDPT